MNIIRLDSAMKNCIKKLFLLITCTAVLLACDRIQQENYTEADEYVNIGFKSSVEIEESPMVSTRSSSNDLYGLQIYSLPQNDSEAGLSEVCWVTDNLNKSSIFLRKNKKYICYLVYVPNGKNIIYCDGKSYGNPFFHLGPKSSPEYDVVHYGAYYDMNFAQYGASRTKDKNDYRIQANLWNQVDIYYGIKEISTTKDEEIQIDLYRMMFGLNIEATNFNKGKIVVYSANESYEATIAENGYAYELNPSQPSLDIELELPYMPWGSGLGYSQHMENLTNLTTWTSFGTAISIDHISESGKTTPLVKQYVDTKRMTKYTIKLNVEEMLSEVEDNITHNIIEDEWSNEPIEVAE